MKSHTKLISQCQRAHSQCYEYRDSTMPHLSKSYHFLWLYGLVCVRTIGNLDCRLAKVQMIGHGEQLTWCLIDSGAEITVITRHLRATVNKMLVNRVQCVCNLFQKHHHSNLRPASLKKFSLCGLKNAFNFAINSGLVFIT